jgi:hypothetical protein
MFVFNLIALETGAQEDSRDTDWFYVLFVLQLKAIKLGYGTIHQRNVITIPLVGIRNTINVYI